MELLNGKELANAVLFLVIAAFIVGIFMIVFNVTGKQQVSTSLVSNESFVYPLPGSGVSLFNDNLGSLVNITNKTYNVQLPSLYSVVGNKIYAK